MKRYIIQAIRKLADNGRLFCSEADFQFALAWELQEILSSAHILLEFGVDVITRSSPSICDTFYVDIVVVLDEKRYYIELKYHTSKCNYSYCGYQIRLKNQGAQDLLRYDYLKDIDRLLTISKTDEGSFGGGYAIVLTNDKLIYETPWSVSKKVLDYFFRIHERVGSRTQEYPIPGGTVLWNNKTKGEGHWTTKGSRAAKLKLPQSINTRWDMYFTDRQDFRYLINEI